MKSIHSNLHERAYFCKPLQWKSEWSVRETSGRRNININISISNECWCEFWVDLLQCKYYFSLLVFVIYVYYIHCECVCVCRSVAIMLTMMAVVKRIFVCKTNILYPCHCHCHYSTNVRHIYIIYSFTRLFSVITVQFHFVHHLHCLNYW